MLEVYIPKGFAKTSGILVEHLADLGTDAIAHYTYTGPHSDRTGNVPPFRAPRPVTARVCWGTSGFGDVPELNMRAGSDDKLSELRRLKGADVPTPEFWTRPPQDESVYPILGRNSIHTGGDDLRVFSSPSEVRDCYFYTKVIPNTDEYRVWVYKNQILGYYHREQIWRVQREGFGRNWWNGWGYVRMWPEHGDAVPETAGDYAKQAVSARRLDFGAVDILKAVSGRYYVLEVNSAPGVESKEQLALKKMARCIKAWYEEL